MFLGLSRLLKSQLNVDLGIFEHVLDVLIASYLDKTYILGNDYICLKHQEKFEVNWNPLNDI